MTMKYSTFMMPLHPPGRNVTESLQEDREAVLLADRLGFSEAYVGEHVTDAAETVTSSMMFLASLASETKNIKLGTGTINLPNSHPAAVAAQAAMLDHLLKGRFIMGISPGGLMSDVEVFGNLGKDRRLAVGARTEALRGHVVTDLLEACRTRGLDLVEVLGLHHWLRAVQTDEVRQLLNRVKELVEVDRACQLNVTKVPRAELVRLLARGAHLTILNHTEPCIKHTVWDRLITLVGLIGSHFNN
jgi:alkanesulfonate monooxygenase SsuD/methylene tetrahydromethanopterin reductase-like flavin-dependent oxidoreductase (luciferase family)